MVGSNGKRIAALCLLLVIGGGWAGLASRYTARAEQAEGTTGADSFLSDSDSTGLDNVNLDNGGLVLRMLLAVGIVIVLGGGALYVSKRVLPRVAHAGGREIRVVETTCLGPRKALHLVEVGGQRLLIGSAGDSITMLSTVGDPWLDVSSQPAEDVVEL
jgi:flagellar biosynthetic protein FliO